MAKREIQKRGSKTMSKHDIINHTRVLFTNYILNQTGSNEITELLIWITYVNNLQLTYTINFLIDDIHIILTIKDFANNETIYSERYRNALS